MQLTYLSLPSDAVFSFFLADPSPISSLSSRFHFSLRLRDIWFDSISSHSFHQAWPVVHHFHHIFVFIFIYGCVHFGSILFHEAGCVVHLLAPFHQAWRVVQLHD